ncbi:glycosyltransferase family 4 protein [Pedobacter sp. BMA]|uniref:glycosyltransferase family 4 protein n=1 Tax=Pedobacter sp. BMA TaxID=1663685 RepID=UPI00064B7BC4|nr:glycosyltransferase family 4 protein [Pedobacter sp. BMA]KLT66642.1 hypothetical protein AB669_05575 [Pedobacter sp. BMA]
MKKFRLAIVISHPIQYYAPLFKLLTETEILLKVFYTLGESNLVDKGFGTTINWDIPLLEGYEYEFIENIAKEKGSHHFKGIQNRDLIDKLTEFLPDAVLVYGWAYSSHLKVMRHFHKKVPVWFRGDSTLLDKQSTFKTILRKLFLTWLYSFVDKALYVGQKNRAYFEFSGLKEDQLVFVPHTVDNERYASLRKEEALVLRQKLNIKDEETLILFAGKFESKKDPEHLLHSFIELNRSNVHLLFVGNGELEKSLKSKVMSSKLKNIHFMDFQNQTQMPVVYQACDLFCLPSQGPGETWGLAVNEAMAAKKAILVSDKAGCAADLVKNQINGYIFEVGNQKSLTTILNVLTEDKKRLILMGNRSGEIIKEWTFQKQVEKIIKETKIAKQRK